MATTRGPLLGLDARGSVGGTVIFSNWKGRSTVKFSPTVANPKTAPQVSRRAMLRFLATNFSSLSPANIATWSSRAQDARVSTYNAWLSYNLDRWARFQYPTKAFPANETEDQGDPNVFTATALNRSIVLHFTNGDFSSRWGYALFRYTSAAFTMSLANCIRVGLWQTGGPTFIDYTDGPLIPGTYYYRLGTFSYTGYQAWEFPTEVNATIA